MHLYNVSKSSLIPIFTNLYLTEYVYGIYEEMVILYVL